MNEPKSIFDDNDYVYITKTFISKETGTTKTIFIKAKWSILSPENVFRTCVNLGILENDNMWGTADVNPLSKEEFYNTLDITTFITLD